MTYVFQLEESDTGRAVRISGPLGERVGVLRRGLDPAYPRMQHRVWWLEVERRDLPWCGSACISLDHSSMDVVEFLAEPDRPR